MKIGFVVNDIETEKAEYTTNRLAMAAKEMGHEAWYMGIGDFAYEPDGSLSTKARAGHAKSYRSLERHLADVQKPDVEQLIGMDEFDVVMLRNDPADDAETDPWRNNAGVAFGQLIASSGVLVVNDPTSLANALSKAYFQHFPEIVRPRTLISRDEDMIEAFITDLGGKAVLKPLQGSGGAGVFLVDRKEAPNLKQIIEAISRDGYVVAQEYLPEAVNGDVRMFVMNGQPLMRRRRVRRVPAHAVDQGHPLQHVRRRQGREGQGHRRRCCEMVEVVRPKLVSDGMFLVGLDIVGDKLMEINAPPPRRPRRTRRRRWCRRPGWPWTRSSRRGGAPRCAPRPSRRAHRRVRR